MATIPVDYGRRVEHKMPVFNFSIPKINFYLNTPAVSVVGPTQYLTKESDGKFHILNPNTQSIYFNSITYSKAQYRDPKLRSNLNLVKLVLVNEYDETNVVGSETIVGTKHYQEYNVLNNGKLIGKLTLVIPVGLLYSNKALLPLTTLEFSAFYEVKNLNMLDIHYYGKTSNDPDKRVGVLDFTFNINCFSTPNFKFRFDTKTKKIVADANNLISEEVVISVITVKTD